MPWTRGLLQAIQAFYQLVYQIWPDFITLRLPYVHHFTQFSVEEGSSDVKQQYFQSYSGSHCQKHTYRLDPAHRSKRLFIINYSNDYSILQPNVPWICRVHPWRLSLLYKPNRISEFWSCGVSLRVSRRRSYATLIFIKPARYFSTCLRVLCGRPAAWPSLSTSSSGSFAHPFCAHWPSVCSRSSISSDQFFSFAVSEMVMSSSWSLSLWYVV